MPSILVKYATGKFTELKGTEEGVAYFQALGQVGEEGNLWDNEETGENGFSRVVDLLNYANVSIMGKVGADTTLSFWGSQNGQDFYFCNIISTSIVPTEPPDYPAWATATVYSIGDIVVAADTNYYRCILNHTSNPSREPPDIVYWEDYTTGVGYPRHFHIFPVLGARYIRLASENNVVVTATVAAKP